MKIATAAYPLDRFQTWDDYAAKITDWVTEAAEAGADLLVFPEYGALELATLSNEDISSAEACMRATDARMAQANDLHDILARKFGVHIVAASAPVWDQGSERPVNRAAVFGPGGQLGHQDKQVMTMFERAPMDVVPGGPLQVFDTALGRIGILICYDVEFPLLGRHLIENGVEILVAPSCTEALSGYWRVRIGAMARALEGQCVTVHSPLVGDAPWCPVAEKNTGAAAIYGPPDLGFPETGVMAEGGMNIPGWVYAEVDPEAVLRVREQGRVRNVSHWEEQIQRLS